MPLNEIAADVFCLPLGFANVYLIGTPVGKWTLVDTGVPGKAAEIRDAAESVYGEGARPEAILLTHGHWDHAGSALELAQYWDVPIFVHALEMPYLTGRSSYPPPDPTVGGFLALLGRFFKSAPCLLDDWVQALEPGREAPGLEGWEWHHTPGHSPGHLVFFRRRDGVLLGGDALVTMNMDSLFATALKVQRVCGPPTPFTPDWPTAWESVKLIADLRPLVIACGHGIPMSGDKAVRELAELAANLPMPAHGRYIPEAARTDENGVVWLPPKPADRLPGAMLALGIATAAGTMFAVAARRRKRSSTADTPEQAS